MKAPTIVGVLLLFAVIIHYTIACDFSQTQSVTIPYTTGASVYVQYDFSEEFVSYEVTRGDSSDVVASFEIEGETQEEVDGVEVTYSVDGFKITIKVTGGNDGTLSASERLSVVPLGLLLGLACLVLHPSARVSPRSWFAVMLIAIFAMSFLAEGGVAETQHCSKLVIKLTVPNEVSTVCIGSVCNPSSTPSSPAQASSSPSTPSPSMVPSSSVTTTPSGTPTPSPTSSITPSISVSSSVTPSPVSPSSTPSISTSPSVTPSISRSPSVTPSITPSISSSPSVTPSISSSPSVTPSKTPSKSATPSRTPSRTPSTSPSTSRSPSVTPSRTPSISVSPSVTPSPVSPSSTPSISTSPSVTPSPVPICADGILQVGEICDDGNLVNGDCCSSTCTFEGTLDGCEAEPNDFPANANGPLTLPFNYSGSIRPADESDYFTFTLSAATTLSVFGSSNFTGNLCGYNAYENWGFAIYDSNGNFQSSLSSGNGQCPSQFVGSHLLPGTYTVRIFAEGGVVVPQYRLYIFSLATCGDGTKGPGEDCEPPTAHCNYTSCLMNPFCGNGIVDQTSELCDDGNNEEGDCCSPVCDYTGINPECEMEPNNNCSAQPVEDLVFNGGRYVAGYVRYPDVDNYVFTIGNKSATVSFYGGDNIHNTSCEISWGTYQLRLYAGNTNCIGYSYLEYANFGHGIYNACPNITRKLIAGTYTLQVLMVNQGPTYPYFVNMTPIAVCGDGVIGPNEVCEPPTPYCNNITCVWDPFCGDKAVNQATEICDDGNNIAGDCCSPQCDLIGEPEGCEHEPNNNCAQVDTAYPDAYPPVSAGYVRRGTIVNSGIWSGYKDYDFYGFTTESWSTVNIKTYSSLTSHTCDLLQSMSTSIQVYQGNCGVSIGFNSSSVSSNYCSTLTTDRQIPPGNYTFRIANDCGYCHNVTQYQAEISYNSYCGNGIIEAPETCDSVTLPCYNCALCGNGIVEREVETCDDGNTISGDGCSFDCSAIEPGWICTQIYNDTYTTCTYPMTEIEPNNNCTTSNTNTSGASLLAWNATLNVGETDFYSVFVNRTGTIVVELAVYGRGGVGTCPPEWVFSYSNPSTVYPISNIADTSAVSCSPSNGASQICYQTRYQKVYFSPPTFTFRLIAGSSQTNSVDYLMFIGIQK